MHFKNGKFHLNLLEIKSGIVNHLKVIPGSEMIYGNWKNGLLDGKAEVLVDRKCLHVM